MTSHICIQISYSRIRIQLFKLVHLYRAMSGAGFLGEAWRDAQGVPEALLRARPGSADTQVRIHVLIYIYIYNIAVSIEPRVLMCVCVLTIIPRYACLPRLFVLHSVCVALPCVCYIHVCLTVCFIRV